MRLVSFFSAILCHAITKLISFFKVSGLRRQTLTLALVFSLLVTAVDIGLNPVAETYADRASYVSSITVSPGSYVAYEGQMVAFSAVSFNSQGQVVQGVKFDWSASDTSKVRLDSTGLAQILAPGKVTITCQAGSRQATATLLVKSGTRPEQSDADWQTDQATATADSTSTKIGKLIDALAPTAEAQGGSTYTDFAYDELWSQPRNLTGMPANRVLDTWKLGTVLPEGSNFTMAMPLYSLGGRGLAANLTLYYNSRMWTRHNVNGTEKITWNPVVTSPAPGFSLGFGRVLTYSQSGSTKYVWVEPNRTLHYLGSGSSSTSGTYQSTDGSEITFVGSQASGGYLYYNDGTRVLISVVNNRLLPTQIREANGNYVSLAYNTSSNCSNYAPMALSSVTDTLGRVIQFNYSKASSNNGWFSCDWLLTSITVAAFGGTAQNPLSVNVVSFDYQSTTVSTNYSGMNQQNAPTSAMPTIKHIYFKDKNTGYLMSYSGYGMAYNISLRKQMSIDQYGVISDGTEVASANFNYPTSGSTQLTDAPAFTQRTESPGGTYSYANSTDTGAQTMTFTTTRPDSSTVNLVRSTDSTSSAYNLLTKAIVKNSSGSVMAESDYTYTTDGGGSTQVQSVVTYDDANQPTKVDYNYDSYGNITDKRDYGFQDSGSWKVRRRSHSTYKTDTSYTNIYLRSLVTEADLYDAQLNTNDADDVLLTKTTFTIDNYTTPNTLEDYDTGSGPASPPNHDSSFSKTYTTRGNLTQVNRYKDIAGGQSITTTTRFDIFGNRIQADVNCCNQETDTRTQNNGWSAPTSVTKGTSPTQLTTAMSYDYNTGLTTSETEPGSVTTTLNYDEINRPTEVDAPAGATTTVSYDGTTLTTTTTVSFTENSSPMSYSTSVTVNGWGQTTTTVNRNGGQVNTSYDSMGRVSSLTNPFQAGGTPSSYTTGFSYDALGRATTTTLQDSNTVQVSYSGHTMTTTDQVGRQSKQEADGLGRLIKATEQDSSGSLTQETTYTYDLRDKLTGVNQGNQTRAWKYDDLGRNTYERIPEQTASINDGSGTYWTMKYTYTDDDLLSTRTDARGVVTTYSYDTLNRITGVSYNVGSTGVPATDSVTYHYNSNGLRDYVSLSGGFREDYTFDSSDRLTQTARTGMGTYTTSYEYNTASQLTKLTYPSGRQVTTTHDSHGRLASVTHANASQGNTNNDYVNSVSYNYAGQLTGWTLASGLAETYGYNNRLQETSQTAALSASPYTSYVNLTYSYSASAGQNGTNTTAGDSGQLMSVSGTINGSTESASYTYDLQHRLVTSSQTTNGTSAQRRFGYDRWGNRTTVYDATSGGNQLQSVSLVQSSSIPTNQISSVTEGTTTLSYSYDANGNVTSDGAHSYAYDAENRLVKVDNGTTAQYWYDHRNFRVKTTVGSTSTHYVWQGSQILAEHNAANGVALVDYVYAGGKLIAKDSAENPYFLLQDRLSIRATVSFNRSQNGGGYTYQSRQGHLPYGEELGNSGTVDKHKFTSYQRDSETVTDYAMNRQYSVDAGRFNRVDPYSGSYNFSSPQSLNRFAYVNDDTVNSIDPLGLVSGGIEGERDINPPGGRHQIGGTEGEVGIYNKKAYEWCIAEIKDINHLFNQAVANISAIFDLSYEWWNFYHDNDYYFQAYGLSFQVEQAIDGSIDLTNPYIQEDLSTYYYWHGNNWSYPRPGAEHEHYRLQQDAIFGYYAAANLEQRATTVRSSCRKYRDLRERLDNMYHNGLVAQYVLKPFFSGVIDEY